ncbi:MAG: DUF5681 domain-containing protein [Sedimenticola sp.]
MANNSDDYEVGYGKPPKEHQFQSGQSGNPKGRPKGMKNLKTDLQEVLNEKVQVNAGGQTHTVTKQRAMLMRAIEQALQGNARTTELLVKLALQHLDNDKGSKAGLLPSAGEEQLLADFIQQQREIIDEEEQES